jgi:hypothetical protein
MLSQAQSSVGEIVLRRKEELELGGAGPSAAFAAETMEAGVLLEVDF